MVEMPRRRPTKLNVKLSQQIMEPRRTFKALNFGSYNYLGFAHPPEHTEKEVLSVLREYGVSFCGTRQNGYNHMLRDLEGRIASYVGKEAALVVGMGYATNSMVLSAFAEKGDLILCDKLNHACVFVGVRASQATYLVFAHNDVRDLERKLKSSIEQGQPGSTADKWIPWRRILIVFEGIYSMEGEFAPLPQIVALKKKYGCYLYMDEAHSMGGTGPHGRGACDVYGVDPADVDIMMGTFTKSFGAIGGYVAARKDFIEYIRERSHASLYGSTLPPACIAQVISCHKIMIGTDGTDLGRERIISQRKNAIRLFKGLRKLGLEIVGMHGSPVMCVMLYNLTKLIAFTRLCQKRNLILCVAGYPAVAFFENRARICVSAQHTKQDIDNCIQILDEVGDLCMIKFKLPWYKRLYRFLF